MVLLYMVYRMNENKNRRCSNKMKAKKGFVDELKAMYDRTFEKSDDVGKKFEPPIPIDALRSLLKDFGLERIGLRWVRR